jgi:hypothetical protein
LFSQVIYRRKRLAYIAVATFGLFVGFVAAIRARNSSSFICICICFFLSQNVPHYHRFVIIFGRVGYSVFHNKIRNSPAKTTAKNLITFNYYLPPVGLYDNNLLPPQVRILQVRTPQVRIPQVRIPQVRIPQVRIIQVRIPQVRTPQVRIPQVRTLQVRTPQVRTPQVRIPQVRTLQVRTPQVRIPQVRIPQVRILQSLKFFFCSVFVIY